MEVIRETLWKRCLSTPIKPSAKNCNICLSETAYQHKGTRKKCKKTNQAAIIQWQRQCLMDKPHRKPWPKSKISLSRVPVHCITPFCSDALVSPPNLYPPWLSSRSARDKTINSLSRGITVYLEQNLKAKWSKSILEEIIMFQERHFVLIIRYKVSQLSSFLLYSLMKSVWSDETGYSRCFALLTSVHFKKNLIQFF